MDSLSYPQLWGAARHSVPLTFNPLSRSMIAGQNDAFVPVVSGVLQGYIPAAPRAVGGYGPNRRDEFMTFEPAHV